MSATENSSTPLRKDKGTSINGDGGGSGNNIGFRPTQGMAVVPPKPQDLQQSYASIVGNDANPKGWYGSMSKSPTIISLLAILFVVHLQR